MVHLTRRYFLRALHNLHNPDLSNEENERLYGKCYRLHGHHYGIEVTVRGEVNRVSGLAVDRDTLDAVVNRELVRRLDGQNLNDHFTNTSGENLTLEFQRILEKVLPPGVLVRVAIRETHKNWFATSP